MNVSSVGSSGGTSRGDSVLSSTSSNSEASNTPSFSSRSSASIFNPEEWTRQNGGGGASFSYDA